MALAAGPADGSPSRYVPVAMTPGMHLPAGAADPAAIARQRFGYLGRLPPPESIRSRQSEIAAQLTRALGEGQAALERQRQSQQAQLEELQKQQKTRFLLALDAQVKADEYALSKDHNEQLMRLQQDAQRKRAQLEQQATSLVLEFQQRKLEEEFYAQQRDIHRQHEEVQSRLATELQKLLAPGKSAGDALWAAPHRNQMPRVNSEGPRRISSFRPLSRVPLSASPSMQLPVGSLMHRSVSCAGTVGSEASLVTTRTLAKPTALASPRYTLR
ncbi:hypothetical protein AK812_SmicGene40052 [Symbiodinium microadriaticum]|uniref:Uncharacterized protein n=1 Tax=Symbiodinium microadriaticum TaxID=2951 RepID=A0A1Q9C9P8_SYMMI|nr:hypothetical protein AK812_SmicGene40052 [Symbiodinium microadriaticum]CAE7845339.1 unnamed protein product [Symbiodinium microadriaticum]